MLSKKIFTGLCLILSTNGFCQTINDNRLKDFSDNLREARSIKEIDISDVNVYVLNEGVNSEDELTTKGVLFETTRTLAQQTNWSAKQIDPGDFDNTDRKESNTLAAATVNGDEILLVGTRNDEVRKFDGSVWRTGTESEVGLPTAFSSNVMAKYQDGPLTYCLLGLSGVEQEYLNGFWVNKPTLYKAAMNGYSYTNWNFMTINLAANFRLPVVDIVVSKRTNPNVNSPDYGKAIIYVAVNNGLGEIQSFDNQVGFYYQDDLSAVQGLANENPNGIWWSVDGGVSFSKLELEKLSTVEK